MSVVSLVLLEELCANTYEVWLQWDLSIKDTLGTLEIPSFFIEVVLNSEII